MSKIDWERQFITSKDLVVLEANPQRDRPFSLLFKTFEDINNAAA